MYDQPTKGGSVSEEEGQDEMACRYRKIHIYVGAMNRWGRGDKRNERG
jgi:hypothetical protein